MLAIDGTLTAMQPRPVTTKRDQVGRSLALAVLWLRIHFAESAISTQILSSPANRERQ